VKAHVPSLALVFCAVGFSAQAETYRCEADGRVAYSDKPCAAGRQSTISAEDPVDPADRAAAAARLRNDKATIAQLDRAREREREQDLRAAALAKKRDSDLGKHMQACAKLARRARTAHDDFDLAGPRDQAKARVRMRRTDEDYAALCKR
jgi:hypothetical protein